MALSASTLALFLLLVPGLIFRYSVYHGSQIKRPFLSSNTIYSSITIILYSMIIFIFYIVLFKTLLALSWWLFGSINHFTIVEFNSQLYIFQDKRRYEIINFAVNFPIITIVSVIVICLMSYLLAISVQFLSLKISLIGRLMYGPLAPLLAQGEATLLTCFVLTKVTHENRRLIYAGYPTEISLREGNNIDHIIIENPEKFYLKLNVQKPTSSFLQARPISTHDYSQSYIYISGTEIENVHFEGFTFKTK